MVRRPLAWMWSHRKTTLGLFLLLALVLLNVLAYLHARAMTHFARDGARTDRPESLSVAQKVKILCTGVTVPRPSGDGLTPERLGLPFEVHHIQGDGVELEAWYVPHPQARGLVLLFHGYAACKAALLPEAEALHELGYATFLVDFRGSGGSSGSETTVGVLEADDVALAVTYAVSRWDGQPLVLYGHSMGSAAILRALAVRGLRPRAAILECPFDRLLNTVGHRFTAMGLPAFPGAQLLVFWGGVQCGFNGFQHNPVEYARHTHCPVLLLHGADDPRVTAEEAEGIFHNLPGEKQFEKFAGSGHESLMAGHPDRWRKLVSAFLSKYAGPGSLSSRLSPGGTSATEALHE